MDEMSVLWISDFSTKHNIGGAQRSDDILIKKGVELGFNITHFTHDSDISLLSRQYHHTVSSNLELIYHKNPEIIGYLMSAQNHSRVEHDMNHYLSEIDRKKLFLNCKNTFFLTNYHYDLFINKYGNIFHNVRIVSDPIDTSVFYDYKKVRENKLLYVGFMHELKGTYDFFNYAMNSPHIEFVVAGWGDELFTHLAKTIPNVNYLGSVEYNAMPELYNKYDTFFYIPRINEPFCRSAGEALLCGMGLAVNDKIGCVHEYNRLGKEGFVSACGKASEIFWSCFEDDYV